MPTMKFCSFILGLIIGLCSIHHWGVNATPGENINPALADTGQETSGGNIVKRQIPCWPPPINANGDCIVCNGETEFEHTQNCWCDLCRPGKYMKKPCVCTADGTVMTPTDCVLAEFEKGYMPVSNWCDRPYPCTECEGDLIPNPRSVCGGADDRTCICPHGKDRHPTNQTACEDIPRCPKNYQSQIVSTNEYPYVKYSCVPCKEGFEQPVDGSLDKCRPIDSLPPKTEGTTTAPSLKPSLTEKSDASGDQTEHACNCPPHDEMPKTPNSNNGDDHKIKDVTDIKEEKNIIEKCEWAQQVSDELIQYKISTAVLAVLLMCVAVGWGFYKIESICSMMPSCRQGSYTVPSSQVSAPRQMRVVAEKHGSPETHLLNSNTSSMNNLDETVPQALDNANDEGNTASSGLLGSQRNPRRRPSISVALPTTNVSSSSSESSSSSS